jgi:hypothetical protein
MRQPYPHIPKSHVAAVRRLDIKWAHDFLTKDRGYPFLAGYSETGTWMTADEVALMSLHQMRLEVGSKKESRESKEWLRARGLRRAFGEPLEPN